MWHEKLGENMSNLTIQIDREVLRYARLRALKEGTSVNAVLREYLENYAGVHNKRLEAAADLLGLAKKTQSRSGGHRWRRDELHQR